MILPTNEPAVRALRELVDRGLISPTPAPRALSEGNIDRREVPPRTSWCVALPGGRRARLVLAANLADLAQRQAGFARACPGTVPDPLFHVRLSQVEALADAYFDGVALEQVALDTPARVREAMGRVGRSLIKTLRASTESARRGEWQAWTQTVEQLPIWSSTERKLLGDEVWPRLYPLLTAGAPTVRWTNGDFTTANILLSAEGEVRLIDCEHAGETHFHFEDGARFYTLSPSARQQPELFSGGLARSGPAWHLYFWLRQVALEVANNSDVYFERMRIHRLGTIRRLAEHLLGCDLTGWSVEATPVHSNLEIARWEHSGSSAVVLSGWCHVPGALLQAVVATRGDTIVAGSASSARPDVQQHLQGDPHAHMSGYELVVPGTAAMTPLLLSAVANDGRWLPLQWVNPDELPGRKPKEEDYPVWADRFDPVPPKPSEEPAGPLFSILLPVYNPPVPYLRACLESVRSQYHQRWELCVVDDASTSPDVHALLAEWAAGEPRVKLQRRDQNGGIARATNDALASAAGDFVVLLDHDDTLRPHALLEFARRLQREPSLDALYSDEDKTTSDGARSVPFLKPDFSPEWLLGVMYIGHALCVRSSVARSAGGFDPAFDGVQDYEFFLRVTEHTRRIGHVPLILYHWRMSDASSALHGNVKGDMDRKQQRAVEAHLLRRGRTEQVVALGRHRQVLRATRRPAFEILPPTDGEDPRGFLRRAADASADVLVVKSAALVSLSDNWAGELAGVAALDDSGLVAPLILAPDGAVHECGWTAGPSGAAPVMRGFATGRDGYNGTLICTREVAAVSPLCIAIRRSVAREFLANAPAGGSWLEFCARLRAAGLFHRVRPTTWARLGSSVPDFIPTGESSPLPDPYFNPLFDPVRADYSLFQGPTRLLSG